MPLSTFAGAGAGLLSNLFNSKNMLTDATDARMDFSDAKTKVAEAKQHVEKNEQKIIQAQRQMDVDLMNSMSKITASIQY
ncbi:MAG: hypothetical protein JWQ11_459 [Rhizobacter sp.]|nr:hypothetical protein [Rhizobacter sp.]